MYHRMHPTCFFWSLLLVLCASGLDSHAAETLGSAPVDRDFTDSAAGQVYVYAGGTFDSGVRVTSFSFYGDHYGGSGAITPILFERSADDVFIVRGVGTGRTVLSSPQVQVFDFGLRYGSDVTGNGNYTFGFINALVDDEGQPTYRGTGTVAFTVGSTGGAGDGGPGTTNRWVFTPSLSGLHAALNATYALPGASGMFGLNNPGAGTWNQDRVYSASLGSTPAEAPTTPISPDPGAYVRTCAEFFALADGHYGEILIDGITDSSGHIRLRNVSVTDSAITAVNGGELRYEGLLSELLGDVFVVSSGHSDESGLRLTVSFKVPQILGGMSAELQFLVTPACVLAPLGARIEIPGTIRKDAFTIERAYLDLLPEEGRFGGGGLFAPDLVTPTFGGWMDLRAGIGPVIDGRRTVDVTKIGAGAGSLGAPIGTTGAFLEYVAAIIENAAGLSHPENWDRSGLIGEFDIVLGRPVRVGNRDIHPYVFSGEGVWSVQDGSFDFNGSGRLLGAIETNRVRLAYEPPFNVSGSGSFDAGIYTGTLTLSQKADAELTGDLRGHLHIPGSVPVIGGLSLASVDASVKGTTLRGRASVEITPGIPEVCIPEECANVPPCTKVYGCWDTCRECKKILGVRVCSMPYPCDCRTKEVCGPRVCTPEICTPAVPPVTVPFAFSFDVGSGGFDFDVFGSFPADPVPPAPGSHAFTFLENWRPAGRITGAGGLLAGEPGRWDSRAWQQETSLLHWEIELEEPVPALVFRLTYENDDVADTAMSIRTPSGILLDSSQGALPFGFAEHVGYSRFNPAAHEQIMLLVGPAPGIYEVTVEDGTALGAAGLDVFAQDAPPTGRITSVRTENGEGRYGVVTWVIEDQEGIDHVRVYLNEQRDGYTGYHVGTVEAPDHEGSYAFDTAGLDVPAGHYFVALVIEDGVNPPVHCVSDSVVEVLPAGRPEPASGLQYHVGDGGFQVHWTASPSEDVMGYLVQWREDHEDLGPFDNQLWVRADGNERQHAIVHGLRNGVPVLVRILAVDVQLHRSAPSEILRLAPRVFGRAHAPRITSRPAEDAAVGHRYVYFPIVEDVDPAEYYEWSLLAGPAGATVDPGSGVMQWTPAPDQVGYHVAILHVTEFFQEGSAETAWREFGIYVYTPEDRNVLLPHAYRFATNPSHDTKEGVVYRYQPVVLGPDRNVRFRLLAGPEGMFVDGRTGLVTWAVPLGARGEWVRLEAIVDDLHAIEQDYYLFVHREDHLLDLRLADDGPEGDPAGSFQQSESCGCAMLPRHRGRPPASHILANTVLWLLPVGLVTLVRRRVRNQGAGKGLLRPK